MTDGRAVRRKDKASTLCFPFGEHNKRLVKVLQLQVMLYLHINWNFNLISTQNSVPRSVLHTENYHNVIIQMCDNINL